ncbi:regulatory protein RecX [Commensalibacter oyaizuii]|uniref:Regulatory protein RecX n=1 Tax=Commensalibacter oyaizuii TaxID=3043873 RepID=A0ABT6Q0A4_9PROT|nr:RecX family transcriptional regulator [Commensalibacter sp. TBRC 16381]MDI2090541.1 RecX family transcriptional regulator [Commensalibacter sp. TBRC 16381]
MNYTKFPDLREYALTYLGRYNNTEAGLKRILNSKLRRWGMKVKEEGMDEEEIQTLLHQGKKQIPDIVVDMKRIGAINDQVFAEYKTQSLIRSGRSSRMVKMKLHEKGIDPSIIQTVVTQYQEKDSEILAALIYMKKRRMGPFRRSDRDVSSDIIRKEQQSLVRGGFSFAMIERLLLMDRCEAEEMVDTLRSL